MDRAKDYNECVMVDWNRETFSVLDGLVQETASVTIGLVWRIASVVDVGLEQRNF